MQKIVNELKEKKQDEQLMSRKFEDDGDITELSKHAWVSSNVM